MNHRDLSAKGFIIQWDVCNSQRQRFVNLASWTFLAIRLDCCGALQGKDVMSKDFLLTWKIPFTFQVLECYRSPVDIRSFDIQDRYFEFEDSKTVPNSQCGFSWDSWISYSSDEAYPTLRIILPLPPHHHQLFHHHPPHHQLFHHLPPHHHQLFHHRPPQHHQLFHHRPPTYAF